MNLRALVASLRERPLARSVAVLVGGTAAAQAISLAVLPIITRVYTPEDFRLLAIYVAIVQLLSVAACFRLELAIPLPKSDVAAANIMALAMGGTLLVSTVACLIILLFSNDLALLVHQPALKALLWCVPIGVFVAGAYAALQFWATRKQRFPLVARTRVTQSVAAAAAQLGLGFSGFGPLGLVIGHLLQSGAGVTSLAKSAYHHDLPQIRRLSWDKMRAAWRRYINFPKYSVIEVLAQTASLQVPIIIIASLPIGPEAGFLALATKLMQAPVSMIGLAVSQVFAASAPQAMRSGTLGPLAGRTMGGLLKFAAGPMLFLGIVGPDLFSFIFGQEWERAGELVRWLTPLFILQMFASSLATSFYVTGRQKVALHLQLLGVFVRVGAVWGIANSVPGLASAAYALAGAAFAAIYLAAAMKCSELSLRSALLQVVSSLPHLGLWLTAGLVVWSVCRLVL